MWYHYVYYCGILNVVFTTIFVLQNIQISNGFRLEITSLSPLFANIKSNTPITSCGCEEKSNLVQLRSKNLTLQDFMIDHGKIWLGGVEAKALEDCGTYCPNLSAMTSHFTFESTLEF